MTPEQARERLEAALQDLDAQDQATESDRAPVELDQQSVGRLSRMDALQAQAMAVANQQRRATERRRIRGALERIGAGEFGYCVGCGEEIPDARLELDPAIPNCVACAAR
jgi:DnaK suppressor protein